ncbi:MAG: hypothetical protein U9O56_06085 [Campylobacterota bacterium]|nr:hypothetical protein [Campylobacterota bacterium]
MIAPQPFKYKCSYCGYSKTVKPKSDVINPIDFNSTCPKCGKKMEREELDAISKIITNLFG